MRRLMILPAVFLAAALVAADEPKLTSRLTVNELMVSMITPATNTLWGVENPQSDAEWQPLEDAAIVVIAAGTLIASGGSGPQDAEWAASADWQAFVATMNAAADDALEAVRERDLEALVTATEVMYPPCEECHQQFHPGMQ